MLPSNGRCLWSHYIATGLHAAIFLRTQDEVLATMASRSLRQWSNLVPGFTSNTFATKPLTFPANNDAPSKQTQSLTSIAVYFRDDIRH
jgi:hypothetical protein